MKKIIPLLMLAFVSIFTVSCDNNDDEVQYVDNDTYAGVIEITRSFQYNSSTQQHFINQQISQYGMLDSDKVLVYRLKGVVSGNDVWQQIPTTIFVNNTDEVNYDFDFTKNDVQIYVDGNYNVMTVTPQYYNNQTFRIVLVPAGYLKGTSSPVDYSDYNAVIKYYNIDDSKVVKIK